MHAMDALNVYSDVLKFASLFAANINTNDQNNFLKVQWRRSDWHYYDSETRVVLN